MTERRLKSERRGYDKLLDRCGKSNRRVSPDRRLNNIAMEWIPFSLIQAHPVARLVFSHSAEDKIEPVA